MNYRVQMYIVTSNPNRKSSKLGLVHFIGILRNSGKNPTLMLKLESNVIRGHGGFDHAHPAQRCQPDHSPHGIANCML